ncbi:MAG: methionyl-tRNA formyltransferase [Actinomycetota bacterium]|nr:methionyl-tRNA formyltransferase [Actinomycetota bacterium]
MIRSRGLRPRLVLIGAVHEAAPAFDVLVSSDRVHLAAVVTPIMRAGGRLAGAVNLTAAAAAAEVAVIHSDDTNDPCVVDAVAALDPDLIVVVGWPQLIRTELLSVPRHGCVGFHASLLPHHRGHAPINWAILRGETRTGNTMFMLDASADTGDIVDQRPIPIGPRDTCDSVYRYVGQVGANMLSAHLDGLATGTAPRHRQPAGVGDVLPRRTPAMGILDWNQSPRRVHDWVRALTKPYPGAFTTLNGRRVMVWASALPFDDEPPGTPGEIMGFERGGIRVGTRDGSILITRMSNERRPEHARRWLRRARVQVGARFDAVSPQTVRWARGEGSCPR